MEKDPFILQTEQLPPPTGSPVPLDQLGNLPVNPTIPQTIELVGPDGFRFSVLRNQNIDPSNSGKVNDSPSLELSDTSDYSGELVDVGVMDLAPIGEMVDSAKISYHGLRARLASSREARARTRVEKMNRKDALYTDLANSLTTPGFVATEKPQTVVERFVDKRIEKKSWKHELKKAKQKHVHKAYRSDKSSTIGMRTKFDTSLRKAIVVEDYTSGNITAAERRRALAQIGATPKKFENQRQRKTRRGATRAGNRFDRAARQPIASRWRALRRATSQRSADRHQRHANKHLQKAVDIQNSRP